MAAEIKSIENKHIQKFNEITPDKEKITLESWLSVLRYLSTEMESIVGIDKSEELLPSVFDLISAYLQKYDRNLTRVHQFKKDEEKEKIAIELANFFHYLTLVIKKLLKEVLLMQSHLPLDIKAFSILYQADYLFSFYKAYSGFSNPLEFFDPTPEGKKIGRTIVIQQSIAGLYKKSSEKVECKDKSIQLVKEIHETLPIDFREDYKLHEEDENVIDIIKKYCFSGQLFQDDLLIIPAGIAQISEEDVGPIKNYLQEYAEEFNSNVFSATCRRFVFAQCYLLLGIHAFQQKDYSSAFNSALASLQCYPSSFYNQDFVPTQYSMMAQFKLMLSFLCDTQKTFSNTEEKRTTLITLPQRRSNLLALLKTYVDPIMADERKMALAFRLKKKNISSSSAESSLSEEAIPQLKALFSFILRLLNNPNEFSALGDSNSTSYATWQERLTEDSEFRQDCNDLLSLLVEICGDPNTITIPPQINRATPIECTGYIELLITKQNNQNQPAGSLLENFNTTLMKANEYNAKKAASEFLDGGDNNSENSFKGKRKNKKACGKVSGHKNRDHKEPSSTKNKPKPSTGTVKCASITQAAENGASASIKSTTSTSIGSSSSKAVVALILETTVAKPAENVAATTLSLSEENTKKKRKRNRNKNKTSQVQKDKEPQAPQENSSIISIAESSSAVENSSPKGLLAKEIQRMKTFIPSLFPSSSHEKLSQLEEPSSILLSASDTIINAHLILTQTPPMYMAMHLKLLSEFIKDSTSSTVIPGALAHLQSDPKAMTAHESLSVASPEIQQAHTTIMELSLSLIQEEAFKARSNHPSITDWMLTYQHVMWWGPPQQQTSASLEATCTDTTSNLPTADPS